MPLRRVDVRSGVGSDTDIGPDFVELPATTGDSVRGGSSSASRGTQQTGHPTARAVTERAEPLERGGTSTTPRTKPATTTTPNRAAWMTHPPTLISGALGLILLEFLLFVWLGLTGWLAVNAIVSLIAVVVATVARLRAQASNRARASRAAGAGRPGVGASRAPRQGIASRFRLRRAGGGRAATGAPGAAGRTGSPTAGRASGAARGNPLSRLFRRGGASRPAGATGGSANPTSGSRPGATGGHRKLWPFGRRGGTSAPSGSTGRGSAGGGASSAGPSGARSTGRRSLWPFGRGRGATSASPGRASAGAGTASGASRGSSAGSGRGSATSPRRSWLRRGTNPTATKPTDKTKPPAAVGTPEQPRRRFLGLWESRPKPDAKVSPAPGRKGADPAPKAADNTAPKGRTPQPEPAPKTRRPDPAPAIPVPRAAGRHSGTPQGGAMTTPVHRDDASLQGWGRNLNTIAPVYEELGRKYNAVHEEDSTAAQALRKIAAQAETDLPVAKPLAAEMQSLAAEASAISNEQEALNTRRRALRDRAAVLPQTYKREHETDEDRLTSPRGGRAAEKRADVAAAEQDT